MKRETANMRLKRRNHPYCIRCGFMRDLEVHHVHPRSDGGRESLDNLAVLCVRCHKEFHRYYDFAGQTEGWHVENFDRFLLEEPGAWRGFKFRYPDVASLFDWATVRAARIGLAQAGGEL